MGVPTGDGGTRERNKGGKEERLHRLPACRWAASTQAVVCARGPNSHGCEKTPAWRRDTLGTASQGGAGPDGVGPGFTQHRPCCCHHLSAFPHAGFVPGHPILHPEGPVTPCTCGVESEGPGSEWRTWQKDRAVSAARCDRKPRAALEDAHTCRRPASWTAAAGVRWALRRGLR